MNIFHVIATANHDRPVFNDLALRADMERGFQQIADEGVQIAAFAFMTAHLHLALGVEEPEDLPGAVHRLLGPPAWNLNRRFQQRGAIFDHSFWRAPVERESYLWTIPLYIHANPGPHASDPRQLEVGARSSHEAWVYGGGPSWLRPGMLLSQFGGDYLGAMTDFLEGRAFGADFTSTLSAHEACVVTAVSRVCGVRPNTLCNPRRGGKRDRLLLCWALNEELGATAAGRALGVSRSTMLRWASQAAADPTLTDWRERVCRT